MSFDWNHIKLGKLTFAMQKWQMVKVFLVSRKLSIQTPETKKEFQFDFDYHLKHNGFHEMHHLVEVTRKNFRINGNPPDLLIAKLTEKLQRSLYPITMKIDPFGRWVGVSNFDEIKSNYTKVKLEIQKVHEGPGLENLMESMENYLETEEKFLHQMMQDSTLFGLFLPVHRFYGIMDKIEKDEFSFPILTKGFLDFKGDLIYTKKDNTMDSLFEGKLIWNQNSLKQLQEYFGISSEQNIQGKLVYKRKTNLYPFTSQNIEIFLENNGSTIYQEFISYQFLHIEN